MTTFAGRYRLEELLGTGGMARVMAATDEVLGRRVAVKIVQPSLSADPVVRERLLREARAAASLSHPNAVAVYDTGEEDGTPYIVMELVDGPTLTEVLLERGPLSADEAVGIADDLLAALGAAHDRGLVHRDVKPGNVLLTPTAGAKLADFGIAKGLQEAAQSLTATGTVIGTPRYLAPEQASGEGATTRSDLYAVGVLLYEMLSGGAPFTKGTPVAVALAHQREAVPPLIDAVPGLAPWLAAIVHRALEKDPDRRFDSAAQMREALARPDAAQRTMAAPAPSGAAAATTQIVETAGSSAFVRAGTGARGPLVVAAAAVLVLVALGAFTMSQDDGSPAAGAQTDPPTEPASTPTPTALPTPTPVPTPTATPVPTEPPPTAEPTAQATRLAQTPEEFVAALARDPDLAGEKGEDLLDKFEELLEEDEAGEQSKKARELIKETEEYVEKGELRPEVGALAIEILEPLAAQEPQGRGRGGGRDDDDDD